MPQRFVPVTTTALLRCRDDRELEVKAGDKGSADGTRFLEIAAVEPAHRVRLEWGAHSYRIRQDVDSDFIAAITIDDHDPVPVLVRSGRLFKYDEYSNSSEPYTAEELSWVGDYLLNLRFDPTGIFAGQGTTRVVAAERGESPTTIGCLGDFASAGAGIGAAGGAVWGGLTGGLPGALANAAAGAAIGASLGGAMGFGYCVLGPAVERLFNWLQH